MAKQKGKGFPLAMVWVFPLAREMPLAMAVAVVMAVAMPLAMPLAMPFPCGLYLNCRHLYYLWILKFYMETFWIAPNSEPSPNTFTPYPYK